MKIITLIPVKNEAWIIESTLENLSLFSDHIIIADQMSTDDSREIYKKFPKVRVIDNLETGHSNKVRWALLDAAREIPGNNLILSIDADEMIPSYFFDRDGEFDLIKKTIRPGDSLSFTWIQLWKSIRYYRDDGVWKNSQKQIGFLDDRISDYDRTPVINDHTARIPNMPGKKIEVSAPLLHFQFVPWERTQMKQAWYRCSEYVPHINTDSRIRIAKKINYKYSATLDTNKNLLPTPQIWLSGITVPSSIGELAPAWHQAEILKWFQMYGVELFEPLQIWHIAALRDIFIEKVGRKPIPKEYSRLLILANKIRRYVFTN